MFNIENTRSIFDIKDRDFVEARHIISKPLVSKNSDDAKVTSWKGRLVCLASIVPNLLDGLYRIILKVFMCVAFPLTFLKVGVEGVTLGQLLKSSLVYAVDVVLTPVAMSSDCIKLLAGGIIHPSIAITVDPSRPSWH